jgi:hypothetical protein
MALPDRAANPTPTVLWGSTGQELDPITAARLPLTRTRVLPEREGRGIARPGAGG